jgi:hypothetical protein
MPSRTEIHVLTEMQLIKRAHSSLDAAEALKQYGEIKGRGGSPVIRYSEFDGYRVFDDLEMRLRP